MHAYTHTHLQSQETYTTFSLQRCWPIPHTWYRNLPVLASCALSMGTTWDLKSKLGTSMLIYSANADINSSTHFFCIKGSKTPKYCMVAQRTANHLSACCVPCGVCEPHKLKHACYPTQSTQYPVIPRCSWQHCHESHRPQEVVVLGVQHLRWWFWGTYYQSRCR